MHDSKAVANFFLDLAKEDGEQLSPMKLIKLSYLAHGWHLGLTGEPLLKDTVEAWRYGPVVPTLYHEFKTFGNTPIKRYASWPTPSPDGVKLVRPKLKTASDRTIAILRHVWQSYKRYSAVQLSDMTHRSGTPWYTTFHEKGAKDRMGVDIPDELIKKHFEELKISRRMARSGGES